MLTIISHTSTCSFPLVALDSGGSTCLGNSVAAVGVRLPDNAPVGVDVDIFVLDRRASGQVNGRRPERVGGSVARRTQGNGVGGIPVTERCDVADDLDGLAIGSGSQLVEGYGNGSGCSAAACRGCRRGTSGTSGGRRRGRGDSGTTLRCLRSREAGDGSGGVRADDGCAVA